MSAKCLPFCSGLNVLRAMGVYEPINDRKDYHKSKNQIISKLRPKNKPAILQTTFSNDLRAWKSSYLNANFIELMMGHHWFM